MILDAACPLNYAHDLNRSLAFFWTGIPGAFCPGVLLNYARTDRTRQAAWMTGSPPNISHIRLQSLGDGTLWGWNPGETRPGNYRTRDVLAMPYDTTYVMTLVPYAPSALTWDYSHLIIPVGSAAFTMNMSTYLNVTIGDNGIAGIYTSANRMQRFAVNQIVATVARGSPHNWALYINGQLDGSGTYSGTMDYSRTVILGSADGYRYLYGVIGEIRVYHHRVLGPAEVAQLYREYLGGYRDVLNWVRPYRRRGVASTGNRRRRVLICGAG